MAFSFAENSDPQKRETLLPSTQSLSVPLERFEKVAGTPGVLVPGLHRVDDLALHRDFRVVDRDALFQGEIGTAPDDLEKSL